MAVIENSNTIEGVLGPLRYAGVPTATQFPRLTVGALVIDTTNAQTYQNTGTLTAPVFTKVGAQT